MYNDPRNSNNRDQQPPQTRAYSRPGDYPEYDAPRYPDPQYGDAPYGAPQYRDPNTGSSPQGYQPGGYDQGDYSRYDYEQQSGRGPTQPRPAKAPRRGPDIDPLMYCGGVLMTGVVTGLAAWLAAWVIRAITQRINETGKLGIWNPLAQDELWFAITGFVVAILGGALWYLLQIATPAPDQFYRWVVGLLIAAAVLLPLLLSAEISSGIGTAVMHLLIGLPVLTLIPTMGHNSRSKR